MMLAPSRKLLTAAALIVIVACCSASSCAADLTVPIVETGPIESIGPRGGIFTGKIDPQGHLVNYWLAFGRKKPSEHHTWLSEELPYRYGGPAGVEEVIENLREGTVYHYRLVAVYDNRTKMVFGGERAFRTKCLKEPDTEPTVVPCRR